MDSRTPFGRCLRRKHSRRQYLTAAIIAVSTAGEKRFCLSNDHALHKLLVGILQVAILIASYMHYWAAASHCIPDHVLTCNASTVACATHIILCQAEQLTVQLLLERPIHYRRLGT